MAFAARIMVLKDKLLDQENVIFDEETESCCVRLSNGSEANWEKWELERARSISADLDTSVALVYVECFGGLCDHWARIYTSGQEIRRFEEHPSLTEIFSELGVILPGDGYYAPLASMRRY